MELEQELVSFSAKRPMALILPSLFSELEGPALGPIIDDLKHASYLREIVIGLDRADNYAEINVSPSGDWAFYSFSGYRERQAIVGPAPAPRSIFVEGDATSRSVSFEVELRRLHELVGPPPWRWPGSGSTPRSNSSCSRARSRGCGEARPT